MISSARSSIRHLLGTAAHAAGLDADVLHTFVFRSWSIAAGAATVVLVPLCLTAIEQGYYYTFASLLTLQIFFDLGMNQVILQLVSHEVAHAGHVRNRRLAALVLLLRRWYAVAALAFFMAVSAGGAWFLSRNAALPPTRWLAPWICLTLATAGNLYLSAMLAAMEGAGQIASVARLRLRQSILGYLATWLALAAGGALWATPLLPLVCVAYTTHWLRSDAHWGTRAESRGHGVNLPRWKHDVFPLQWRLALSWISGYFIFQLLTPLVFAYHGAIEAGRVGITLGVFNAVLTAGMSWVNAKFPALSMHLARNERPEANVLFRGVAARALLFTATVSGVVLLAIWAADEFAPAVALRFAPLSVATCIAVATVANTFVFAAAAYLRAHKEEPMLRISLVSGLAMAGAVAVGSRAGVLPMMALYMAVTVLIPLPWTWTIFRRYFDRVS